MLTIALIAVTSIIAILFGVIGHRKEGSSLIGTLCQIVAAGGVIGLATALVLLRA